jgi:serine/threonine protein phosphatase PrpC
MYIVANQLELSNGVRRDRGDCLVDAEQIIPPPVLQKRGTLYIITETENMAGGKPRHGDIELCKEVQETILHDFYNTANTSITGALKHALDKANQLVFNYNSTLMPPERRGVGLTVALVRGNEVYSGQMLPTRAYLYHQGELKTLPTAALTAQANRSTDQLTGGRTAASGGSTDPQSTLPLPRHTSLPSLGRYTTIDPILSRNIFEAGDLLMLCSASYTRVLNDESLLWILDQPDSRGALINLSEYSRNQNLNDGYAIIIGAREEIGARPFTDRQTDNGWKGTAENMAGAVSLLAARLNPLGPRPNAAPGENDDYLEDSEAPFVARGIPAQEAKRVTGPINLAGRPPVVSETEENDPLATKDPDSGSWMHREGDDLNRPAFLKGRSLNPEPESPSIAGSKDAITSPGPIKPKPFTSRLGGDGTMTPSVPTGVRKFSYTDASQDQNLNTPPVNIPFSTRPYVQSFRAPIPEAPPPPPDQFDEPIEISKRRRAKKPAAPQGQVSAEPLDNPYFDMVGGDGYGPPVKQKWSFNNMSVRNRSLVMGGIGLVLGLAVVLLILSVSGGSIIGNESKARQLVTQAEAKRVSALQLVETNPNGARDLLTQANDLLADARKEKPDLGEIQATANAVRQTLNTVNKVTIPLDLRVALDLANQGPNVNLSKAIISAKGDQLYLMDTGQNAIYTADVLGAVKPILKSGDKAGNNAFGKPVTMVARPDGLLVLDDANLAWSYNKAANTWTAQPLGGSPKGKLQAASYQGNLYLTGTGTGQILKYNAGNYAAKPDEWVNPNLVASLNLDKAGGFAIDGNVYSLNSAGHVYQMARPNGKIQGEVLRDFDLTKDARLGPPLNAPYVLNVGSLDYPFMFVLDAENRVLQFGKSNGAYIQQFQSAEGNTEFTGLKDVAVDEANKKVYLISAQKVYVYNLTDAPASPAVTPGAQTQPAGTPGTSGTPGAGANVTIISTQPTAKP